MYLVHYFPFCDDSFNLAPQMLDSCPIIPPDCTYSIKLICQLAPKSTVVVQGQSRTVVYIFFLTNATSASDMSTM